MELSMAKGNQFVEATQSPEGAAAWKQQLDEFAPGASDWVVAAVFGGTYQRDGLELRDSQMLNMAALAAMGCMKTAFEDRQRAEHSMIGITMQKGIALVQ